MPDYCSHCRCYSGRGASAKTVTAIVSWLREQAQMHGYGFMRPTPEVVIAERLADLIEKREWATPSPSNPSSGKVEP